MNIVTSENGVSTPMGKYFDDLFSIIGLECNCRYYCDSEYVKSELFNTTIYLEPCIPHTEMLNKVITKKEVALWK
tara:strand:- start:23314 stop:23538 length:225 start_codon:yes stop_codon:yes gene_type:complete